MPKTAIPQTPIPKLTQAELDEADLCARALWHGISYKTGKLITSDTDLLDRFATPFYGIPSNNLQYSATTNDLHDLIIVCELKVLYKGIAGMDLQKGLNCIGSDIYPYIYSYWASRGIPAPDEIYGSEAVMRLSKALCVSSDGERTVLASRMLFFIAPDMQCFNMNNRVAIAYGLPTRAHHYRERFCILMANGQSANKTRLVKYSIPQWKYGMNVNTWNKVSTSDWWQRRVLDLAVLNKLKLGKPMAGLHTRLKEHLSLHPPY
jgi:hypothetical protein